MIEKVLVLNLPHRIDRRYFMLGHLLTIGVPKDLIEIFPAKYGRDYKTFDAIVDDAIADGFPDFADFRRYQSQYPPPYFSYLWNWCRMLREIQEYGLITLILLDDRMLQIDWRTLNGSIEPLVTDFKLLQIGWFMDGEHQYISGEQVNEIIAEGTRSGDWATVLSSVGAAFLFDSIYKEKHCPEWYLGYLSNKPVIPGVYRCIESKVIDAEAHRVRWGQDIHPEDWNEDDYK